jgi:hypothetical protein
MTGQEAFDAFLRNCEEVCRHDQGSSDERAILEYLEDTYGISSCRYEWGKHD